MSQAGLHLGREYEMGLARRPKALSHATSLELSSRDSLPMPELGDKKNWLGLGRTGSMNSSIVCCLACLEKSPPPIQRPGLGYYIKQLASSIYISEFVQLTLSASRRC